MRTYTLSAIQAPFVPLDRDMTAPTTTEASFEPTLATRRRRRSPRPSRRSPCRGWRLQLEPVQVFKHQPGASRRSECRSGERCSTGEGPCVSCLLASASRTRHESRQARPDSVDRPVRISADFHGHTGICPLALADTALRFGTCGPSLFSAIAENSADARAVFRTAAATCRRTRREYRRMNGATRRGATRRADATEDADLRMAACS